MRRTTWKGAHALRRWLSGSRPWLVLGGVLAAGCYQPEWTADLAVDDTGPYWTPPSIDAGAFEAGGAAPAPQDADVDAYVVGPRSLVFRVLTAPFGGRYAPRNIGAIWIQTEAGAFVKTLKLWAATRQMYLRKFQAASGGDVTDAITSATLEVHERHEVSWDFTDRTGARVPDGTYQLMLELTDRDASGASLAIPFVKGSDALYVMPTSSAQFLNMELIVQ